MNVLASHPLVFAALVSIPRANFSIRIGEHLQLHCSVHIRLTPLLWAAVAVCVCARALFLRLAHEIYSLSPFSSSYGLWVSIFAAVYGFAHNISLVLGVWAVCGRFRIRCLFTVCSVCFVCYASIVCIFSILSARCCAVLWLTPTQQTIISFS